MANLRNIRVSGRYATALCELAIETNQMDSVRKDMELVHDAVSKSRELLLVFRNPLINVQKKVLILDDLFQSRICELTLKFLKLITRKGRIVCLESITDSFIQMHDKYRNVKTVFVETAIGIDEQTKEKFRTLMATHTSSNINLVPLIRPEIIGGFRLRFDDYIYDASLKSKFVVLKKEFEKNIYERKL